MDIEAEDMIRSCLISSVFFFDSLENLCGRPCEYLEIPCKRNNTSLLVNDAISLRYFTVQVILLLWRGIKPEQDTFSALLCRDG